MKAAVKHFAGLQVTGQLEFLKSDDFTCFERHEKIAFLKAVLKEGLLPKTVTAVLELLRELNYLDKFFFRQFQYHIDSSVANAAQKAIKQKVENNDSTCAKLTRMLREGSSDDRMLIANCFIEGGGKLNEDALISFLCFDDPGMRKNILNKITPAHELDESKLSAVLKNGSGIAWYARAALVEILGKRKSRHLLDSVDYLLNDKNVDVKLKLIAALFQLQEENVKPYIQRLADDTIPWVKKEARRVLQSM